MAVSVVLIMEKEKEREACVVVENLETSLKKY